MNYLVLIRHGLSEYNKKDLWTGWYDSPLCEEGKEEAARSAQRIKDIPITIGYTSPLSRCKETLEIIKNSLHLNIPVEIDKTLNERNYGDYTGKNKVDVKQNLGEEEFFKLRRSWDYPVPNGESLKDVYNRVVPYYSSVMLPKLLQGNNVLIVSSGNALRALVKHIEKISDENIKKLEIPTGQIYIYKLNNSGEIVSKEIR